MVQKVNNTLFTTEPELDDLQGIVDAQRDAWRATYPSPENGVSEEWVYERSSNLSADYIAERLPKYKSDLNDLYLVAKTNSGEVCGFIHAEKLADYNELSALYISPQFIGSGAGGLLMKKFLAWIDITKPSRLECASYNQHAIGFYEHYGFKITDAELPKFGGVMPIVEMIRPADERDKK